MFGAGQGPSAKPFMLNLEQIVELGFINSREFQTIREQLYLTALLVTAERFAFIAQPFVTERWSASAAAGNSADGQTNRWLSSTTTGFTKAFSTGALLLMNFANQTVYNLGGGSLGMTSVSNVSLDFVQPFLAGGGRAVALEPLTQAERNLVYAIRDFYRFRQEFFVFFAAGQSTASSPASGPASSPSRPTRCSSPRRFVPGPFTLPLDANPANVQVAPQPYLGADLDSGVTTTPQGYLSRSSRNGPSSSTPTRTSRTCNASCVLLRAYLEGGLVNQVQAGQVEQQLLRSIEGVLAAQANYRVSLDQLKQQLGLPMTVHIELDLAPLQPMIDLIEGYEKLFIDTERVSDGACSCTERKPANCGSGCTDCSNARR